MLSGECCFRSLREGIARSRSAVLAAKRARAPALDAAVFTFEVSVLGLPFGLLVLADGTRLVSTFHNRLQLLTHAGLLATLAGGNHDDDDDDDDATLVDGQGPAALFNCPGCMTVYAPQQRKGSP